MDPVECRRLITHCRSVNGLGIPGNRTTVRKDWRNKRIIAGDFPNMIGAGTIRADNDIPVFHSFGNDPEIPTCKTRRDLRLARVSNKINRYEFFIELAPCIGKVRC